MRRLFPAAIQADTLALLALVCLAPAPVNANATPADCRTAAFLSLQKSTPGYVSPGDSVIHAVEIETPGILVVEARGTDSPPISPAVRFLGSHCPATAGGWPVPATRSRHVHRVAPGTALVEIAAGERGGGYRVDAWLAGEAVLPTKEEMDESDELGDRCLPTKEEMDESDELGGGFPPTKEEMDESDELGGGCLPTKEEMDESDEVIDDLPALYHALCPWGRRPDLLATFTCAPRIRLAARDAVAVTVPAAGDRRLIGVTLASAGHLGVETDDDPPALVFAADGSLVVELEGDEAIWLEAGDHFVETVAGDGPIWLYADLD